MSSRIVRRLIWGLSAALMVSLFVQLIGGYDFRGLPFLYFGIAIAAVWVIAVLTNLNTR
jgi:hypothetical protein